jgi:hypothetical protein
VATTSMNWETLLAAPAAGQHIAQLHSEPGFLERAVGAFVGEGLRRGDAVIVIATPLHWKAITRQLEGERCDLDGPRRHGQLTVLDADSCLAQLLVDGMPDHERFRTVIGGTVDAAERAGYSGIRVFGEMVDILRGTGLIATSRLEALWIELLATRRMTLLCGYSVDIFDPQVYGGLLQGVCAAHSAVLPVEDWARLELAVERAYTDTFGTAGEADSLRRTFLADYDRSAAMPDAQASLLAIREFVPMTTGALLRRARQYYGPASISSSPA